VSASLKSKDNDAWMPLSWAAWDSHKAKPKQLADKDANLEAKGND